MSRLVLLLTILVAMAMACGAPERQAPLAAPLAAPPPTAASSSPPVASSDAATPPMPPSLPSSTPPPSASSPPPKAVQPGELRCGDQHCARGAQVCCAYGKRDGGSDGLSWTHACVTRLRSWPPAGGWGEHEVMQRAVDKQARACEPSLGEPAGADVELRYCASSADCPQPMTCCRHMWTYDYEVNLCTPPGSNGSHACPKHEVCYQDGAECAKPDDRCSDGACRPSARQVSCGAKRCRLPTPVCCVHAGSTSCVAKTADCSSRDGAKLVLECASRDDCPAGMYCGSYAWAGICEGQAEEAHVTYLCETAADCPVPAPYMGIAKYRCASRGDPAWLRTCTP